MGLFKQTLKKFETEKTIPGVEAFKLHDTYGFPIEITKEIAEEYNYRVDEEGFNREMEQQRDRARKAEVLIDKLQKLSTLDLDRLPPTKFVGYEKTTEEVTILAVFPKEKLVVFDKTPFYRESGGQIGDKGILNVGKQEILVLDTYSNPKGIYVHELDNTEGLEKFMRVRLTVDTSRRKATEIHHTATHLLHNALREVLGEHVRQAGSYVGPDKLRFDFTHFAAVKPSEIDKAEQIINQKIKERMKVEVSEKNFQDAIKMGAVALFGEKYGDRVRVLKIGNYSMELCTGTHARSTEDLLFFIILSESALGAGLRRIEALAGQAAKIYVMFKAKSMHNEIVELIRRYRMLEIAKGTLGGSRFMETGIFEIDVTEIDSLSKAVDNQDSINVKKFLEHLTGRVEWLRDRIAKAEREIEDLKLQQFKETASVYASEMIKSGEINGLVKEFKGFSMEMLRVISDAMQKETKSCIIALASVSLDKLIFLITVTPDLIAQGHSAIKLAEVFSAAVGGKSGGKENRVEGGGKDPSKAKEGLEKVLELLRK
jgi:alanyl-tRNA synthetase